MSVLTLHNRTDGGKPMHSVIFYHIALSKQTCHMLMVEPSTYDMFAFLKKNDYEYDMFALIELYGTQLQSVC